MLFQTYLIIFVAYLCIFVSVEGSSNVESAISEITQPNINLSNIARGFKEAGNRKIRKPKPNKLGSNN
jgi:hypothetical protein